MSAAAMALNDTLDEGGEADGADRAVRAKKAPNAFRTISEVADDLHIPQHVLRFWETKFPQVKPLKRGGGRRYYRPDDITLLRKISDMLYNQGYTIKGVQRLLREGGGHLADNIPPPSAEEKAEAERSAENHPGPVDFAPQLPMPGLDPIAPPKPAVRPAARPDARAKPAADGTEVDRLRALLATTLAELRALRALLP